MENIYILGCGGFAKEVYYLIKSSKSYTVKGFVNFEKKDDVVFQEAIVPVITDEDFLNYHKDTNLAIGVGSPKLIKILTQKFGKFNFPNLFHPSVTGDFANIEIGKGNIFTTNVTLTTDIKIGDFNIFNLHTTVGHDVRIGNFNVFNPSVNISGGVEIGNANLIGVGAVILEYKKISSDSVVGASALVNKNVPDNDIVVGVPAKSIVGINKV